MPPFPTEPSTPLVVRLPRRLCRALRLRAAATDQPAKALIRTALEEHLARCLAAPLPTPTTTNRCPQRGRTARLLYRGPIS